MRSMPQQMVDPELDPLLPASRRAEPGRAGPLPLRLSVHRYSGKCRSLAISHSILTDAVCWGAASRIRSRFWC